MTVALAIAGLGLGATSLVAAPLVVAEATVETGTPSPMADVSSRAMIRVAQAAPAQAESNSPAAAPVAPADQHHAEPQAAPTQAQPTATQAPAGVAVEAVEVEVETIVPVQQAPAHAAGHGENIVDKHAAHFPPFDVKTFPSQLLWLAITFILLYLLMSRVTLPRIGRILEERRDRIADDLEEGVKLKAESEAAQVAYEKALSEARARANAIAGETRAKLAAESDANRKALEADLNSKLEAAEQRIAATKVEALSHVRGIAVDTAQAIVSALVGANLPATQVEKAVDTALARKDAA